LGLGRVRVRVVVRVVVMGYGVWVMSYG
jgi:hypothetical protein